MKKRNNKDLFTEFVAHLFPRRVYAPNMKITYTFCLGGLALMAFMVLLATGALLLFYYQPTPEHAYDSILFLESRVFGGLYIRSLHRLSSHVFLVLIFLHTLRVIFTGAYSKPRDLNWILGFVLLCLSLFGAYTGYVLPLDQMGFWAARTGMELLETALPGQVFRTLLAPDGIGGELSLLRFYILHIGAIPVGIISLCFLHFYQIRKNRGLLPYL